MIHATATTTLDRENPWPGLESYEEDAHDFFFGRDHKVEEFLNKLLDAPVTVLYGRSGLGKTSLLRAGLFPLLRAHDILPIYVRFGLESGAAPLTTQLRDAVRESIQQAELSDPMLPSEDEFLWEYLHRNDFELWSRRNYPLTPIIVLDQFEELFTLGERFPDRIEAFRNDLGDLVENRIPAKLAAQIKNGEVEAGRFNLRSRNYKMLITLREDYLPHLDEWCRLIPALGRSRMRLLPLRDSEALEAVYKPAADLMTESLARRVVGIIAGADLHPGRDTTSSGVDPAAESRRTTEVEPALLSLVCRELNEERKKRGQEQFDEALVEEHGRKTLSNYYSACVRDMRPEVAEFIECELITETGFRDFYALEDAVPSRLTEDELTQLIDSRLVRLAEYHGAQRIELTHDVLTRTVLEHRNRRRTEEEKAALAAHAEQEKHAFEEAAERHREELDRERRAGRRLRWLSAALAVVCIVAVVLALIAQKRLHEALAERLNARGQVMLLTGDPGSELEAFDKLLAVQKISDKAGSSGLLNALIGKPRLEKVVDLSGDASLLSADGRSVVTEAKAGMQLLSAYTGAQLGRPFGDSTLTIRALSWDGRYVLAGTGDEIQVWATGSGTSSGESISGDRFLPPMAVSPDGKRVATAEVSGEWSAVTIRLWDTGTGREVSSHEVPRVDFVTALEFNRNGHSLAVGTWNGTVTLWDTTAGALQYSRTLPSPLPDAEANLRNVVRSIAFSPDGLNLAAGGGEGGVIALTVWAADSGELKSFSRSPSALGNPGDVSVAFNSDGSRVVTGSTDGNVSVKSVATGKQISDNIGFMEPVTQVAFRDDRILSISGQILSTSNPAPEAGLATELQGSKSPYLDGSDAFALYLDDVGPRIAAIQQNTLRWLDPDTGEETGRTVSDALLDVSQIEQDLDIEQTLDISPDRQWLALAGPGADIRIINASTGQLRTNPLRGHTDKVRQVVFSPGGDTLASVGDDRKIRLWDWRNGREIDAADTGDIPDAVEFSRDGERLYTRSYESIRIWDNQLHPVGEPITGRYIVAWAFADRAGNFAAVEAVNGGVYVIQQYDAENGQRIGDPLEGLRNIVSVDYTSDGRYLVSLGRDAAVRFWDVGSGEQVGMAVPIAPVGDSGYVALSDDDRRVFVSAIVAQASAGLYDGGVWEIPGPAAWAEKLCAKLTSNPSEEQWDQWISEDVDYKEPCRGKPRTR